MLNSSILGYLIKLKPSFLNIEKLTEVKSKKIITSTSSATNPLKSFPLDIVGLTIDDPDNARSSNIIIPERNEGNLMKLNINGELLAESNLKSEFKNSCGVCINIKKEILVTDGKLNKIFRFGSNLKLLQIIGSYLGTRYGRLNFPW